MTILDRNIFSPSENKKLKHLLKKPEEDLKKVGSLLENKIVEYKKNLREIDEKYHALIDGLTYAGIGIDIISKDHKVIFQNQVLKERFGAIKDESCYVKYRGLEKACESCPMEEALKYNMAKRIELDAADGRSYELISAPFPNQDGSIDKVVEVIIDITERRKIEDKLRESEEKYRNLFKYSPIGIFLFDKDGNLLEGNTNIPYSFSGYPSHFSLGNNFTELLKFFKNSSELIPIFKKRAEKRASGKVLEPIELKLVRQDGKIRWIYWQSSTIKLKDHVIIQAIVQDITDRKLVEQKLRESEEKFRTIAEQSLMGIAIIQDDLFKYFNKRISENTGYSVEEIKSWGSRELLKTIHPGDRKFVMEQARKKQRGDSNVVNHYHFKILRKNGGPRWLELFSKTINYENRSADLIMTFDITDKIEAEQKLKESEEKFRNIAEQSLIGIGIIQDNVIKYANKKFSDLFGYSIDEILNWSLEEFMKTVHPKDREFVSEQVKKKQSNSEEYLQNYQFRGLTKSGKIIWIENFTKSIIYEGRVSDFVAFIDITEKINAQKEVLKLSQLKSELLRRTSHELKTPLVSIKGFTELLLKIHRDKLDAMVISTLNEIKHGCIRLETLIDDILKTAELESGTTQLHKSEEDLTFLIKYCVNEIKGFSKLRNHKINLELKENLITQFEKEQIHQVISNLLNNAVKYTPPGGLIEIKSEIRDDFIKISIKDNGIGFTEEEKTRIFKQFGKIERYGQGLDIIAEGSGFGLFISKKIIELHGGEIWVESEGRRKGSTIYFSLPLI
ncbi:MAG: PAS domain S-box protein [Candidatus Odinarchaeota archaeon]